jgi:UDP-N-acetylglucosamine--N-acetylmuramyl-(pentapeptide) pyrophosphoryl-undecaprenol N-acetylglucosamine transferase
MQGRAKAGELYRTFRPSVVVGFGGYPALPALLAPRGYRCRPCCTNRTRCWAASTGWSARRATAIATAYAARAARAGQGGGQGAPVGNPVRDDVRRAGDQALSALDADASSGCLVSGGSQGATVLSDRRPRWPWHAALSFRQRLQVTQQLPGGGYEGGARTRYAALDPCGLATYLPDMPDKLALDAPGDRARGRVDDRGC